jgi:hypothetical protein
MSFLELSPSFYQPLEFAPILVKNDFPGVAMSNPFQQLKDRFKAIGPNLTTEGAATAKASLREWLDANTDIVRRRRNQGEFNGTMMQYFHWYTPADGSHWNQVKGAAEALANAGHYRPMAATRLQRHWRGLRCRLRSLRPI